MKRLSVVIAFFVIAGMVACGENSSHERNAVEPGVLLAEDSLRISEDKLNELYFTIRLETTEKSDSGLYQVTASWGYNEGTAKIALPKDLELAEPDIRRDSGYIYIVGFRTKEDTSFHDYFQVSAENGNIKMRYIKAYYF